MTPNFCVTYVLYQYFKWELGGSGGVLCFGVQYLPVLSTTSYLAFREKSLARIEIQMNGGKCSPRYFVRLEGRSED
jgi:hypothetical protein